MNEDEYRCDRLAPLVKSTADWKAEHEPHLGESVSFSEKRVGYEARTLVYLVCPCGAEHLLRVGI